MISDLGFLISDFRYQIFDVWRGLDSKTQGNWRQPTNKQNLNAEINAPPTRVGRALENGRQENL